MAPLERQISEAQGLIEWLGTGAFPPIRCTVPALEGVTEAVMAGYRRNPWGGPENGGILFGTHTASGICIVSHRAVECEHENGPVFELSSKDAAGLERAIEAAASEPDLTGLVPVGWYHSVSTRGLGLSEPDRRMHEKHFPEPWQTAMVLRRSKKGPLEIGLYQCNASGVLESHSARREFVIEDLRLSAPDLELVFVEPEPRMEAPEVIAETADVVIPDVASFISPLPEPEPVLETIPEPIAPEASAAPPAEPVVEPFLSHTEPVPEPFVPPTEPVAEPFISHPELVPEESFTSHPELVPEESFTSYAEPIPEESYTLHVEPVPQESFTSHTEPAPEPFIPHVEPVIIETAAKVTIPEPAPKIVLAPTPPIARPIADPQLELPLSPENPYEFLGLDEDPFRAAPNPQFFYPSPQHREALAVLTHGILNRSGFMALTGEAGTGKSLLLECLIEQFREKSVEFAFLPNCRISTEQFFELLADDLDLKCGHYSKTSVLIALNERLLARSQRSEITALIIDNAQKLPLDVLEEIELLGNLETRRGPLLQVLFAAQPDFERQIERAEVRGLRQRLRLRARLGPFSARETEAYVESRMAAAGAIGQTVFPTDLLMEVHIRTYGIPRLINAVAAGVLEECLSTHRRYADIHMLDRVSAMLDLAGLQPSDEEESESRDLSEAID